MELTHLKANLRIFVELAGFPGKHRGAPLRAYFSLTPPPSFGRNVALTTAPREPTSIFQ